MWDQVFLWVFCLILCVCLILYGVLVCDVEGVYFEWMQLQFVVGVCVVDVVFDQVYFVYFMMVEVD